MIKMITIELLRFMEAEISLASDFEGEAGGDPLNQYVIAAQWVGNEGSASACDCPRARLRPHSSASSPAATNTPHLHFERDPPPYSLPKLWKSAGDVGVP
jgi:hypothetical protein